MEILYSDDEIAVKMEDNTFKGEDTDADQLGFDRGSARGTEDAVRLTTPLDAKACRESIEIKI